jgi:hypothetical protein
MATLDIQPGVINATALTSDQVSNPVSTLEEREARIQKAAVTEAEKMRQIQMLAAVANASAGRGVTAYN